MRTLIKQSKHCPNIAEYLRVGQECEKNCAEFSNKHRENTPKKGIPLSRWLKNSGDKETIQQYADIYLNEIDPEKRAEALEAFSRCPFPENPMPIIDDTTSDCTHLKEAAWRALENIRHPFVREFSILHMYDEIETALPVFIANYQTQDEEQLVTLVKSIPIDFKCTTAWHGIHLDVLHMVDNRLKVPASLLYHIYENTYCSCCRGYALRLMGKRRLLTDDIL